MIGRPTQPPAPSQRRQYSFLWWQAAAVGILLVPVSSILGVQPWRMGVLWIWKISVAADVVFVMGTVTAHVLVSRIGARQPSHLNTGTIAFTLGILAHWTVYTISWSLVVGPGGADGVFVYGGYVFTLAIGYLGIFASALVDVAGAFLHRSPQRPPRGHLPTRGATQARPGTLRGPRSPRP